MDPQLFEGGKLSTVVDCKHVLEMLEIFLRGTVQIKDAFVSLHFTNLEHDKNWLLFKASLKWPLGELEVLALFWLQKLLLGPTWQMQQMRAFPGSAALNCTACVEYISTNRNAERHETAYITRENHELPQKCRQGAAANLLCGRAY